MRIGTAHWPGWQVVRRFVSGRITAIGGFLPNSSAVLYAAGDLRIEDRPEPQPGEDQVVVEVTAVEVWVRRPLLRPWSNR